MSDINAQELYEAQRVYTDFFDQNAKYIDRIKSLVAKRDIRLIVDLNDLRLISEERVEKLLKNSFLEINACQKALKLCIGNIDVTYCNEQEQFFVGFEGSFGARHLNPRTLKSDHLGNMVCIEGIVTRMSCVKSKLERSVHYCPATNKTSERRYADMTSLEPYPSSGAYPSKDDQGNVLETEYGLCNYKDHQTFTIQEMPEHTPAGQLPRFAEVVLEHDLVDTCKAGDRVYVTGQYRCLPGKRNGFTTATFRSIVIANNVYQFTKQMSTKLDDLDLKNIVDVSKNKDILDLLTRSVAPSICGHDFIKRAILCQLLGGVERILTNGSRIRGDINLLLLGDPSVAKSQFLRFVLQCARDRAIATTGRGSSGVGLTAAVTTDRESGERSLEAGAMVLADRGIVCIDEFDKMSDIDRTAIHEVMEQGRVTIAKAGIQAKLNARCSVLAAANPVYGRYDQYKTPMENIGLQDSLLSRFDLLFIVLDQIDEETDRALGQFVLESHMYRAAGEEDGHAMSLQGVHNVEMVGIDEDNSGEHTNLIKGQIFEEASKYNSRPFFNKVFFEKYIQVARQLKPKLSKEASKILVDKYCDLRIQETEMAESGGDAANRHRTQPVTARTLETLIRLATAHAKARMKKVVSRRDAEAAADLVSFVMFKEVLKKRTKAAHKRLRPTGEESGEDEEAEGEEDSEVDDITITGTSKKLRTEQQEEAEEEQAGVAAAGEELSEEDFSRLKKMVSDVFSLRHESDLEVTEIINYVREHSGGRISELLVKAALQKLHDLNRLMLHEDRVYMI